MENPGSALTPSPADVVAQLVASHRDFLGFLERRLGNRAEAEDVLQEAFVKSVERASSLRSDESVVAWFYRTLRNTVIDRYRRRAAADRTMAALAQELEAAVEPPPELRAAVCRCVSTLTDSLKPEYADALRRIDIEGLSVKDYAQAIDIEPGNAAVRVHRARQALRQRVQIACGTCAEHGCLDCTCRASSTA